MAWTAFLAENGADGNVPLGLAQLVTQLIGVGGIACGLWFIRGLKASIEQAEDRHNRLMVDVQDLDHRSSSDAHELTRGIARLAEMNASQEKSLAVHSEKITVLQRDFKRIANGHAKGDDE